MNEWTNEQAKQWAREQMDKANEWMHFMMHCWTEPTIMRVSAFLMAKLGESPNCLPWAKFLPISSQPQETALNLSHVSTGYKIWLSWQANRWESVLRIHVWVLERRERIKELILIENLLMILAQSQSLWVCGIFNPHKSPTPQLLVYHSFSYWNQGSEDPWHAHGHSPVSDEPGNPHPVLKKRAGLEPTQMPPWEPLWEPETRGLPRGEEHEGAVSLQVHGCSAAFV